ncbi:transcriptional regulator [Staphylococcus felis]|uniref:Transcriptional regulator n=2 Tax=Staphylococcus felis TaxID=46127 RepID=A0AAX1RUH6_9STAP|nr:helix-turn-helix transcriptional regulator [Staphylococcus felis]REH78558.1 transcriptional regulator [Staphylococcus felis]REH81896.1 transcriptional regulator [Staphylococcus felis]REI00302.1 transcriptional regulator [Staphylococcus felis]REI18339.1 transcriptional regulator [Staphylococcus felis]REI18728.1 transcriptional regulator [Staphylococcus felis]
MDVGQQIRRYRTECELSQAELAEKIYVSSQTISNWENERSYPDLHHLIVLSTLFQVSLDQLVKGDVEDMKNAVDQSNMDKYGWLMCLFIALAAISTGPALKYSEGWFGLLVPVILWAISMHYALKIERIKKKHDVQTYREILDYMENGKKTIQTPRNKKKYMAEKFLIVVGFGVVVMAIVFISTWIFSMI